MKKYILSLVILFSTSLIAQKQVLLNENFTKKMEDVKETWSDFEISTKVNAKDAKFVAHLCRYFSNSSPAQPCDCSKGRVNIEMTKKDAVPFLEFPELPSCGVLKLGIQSNGKDTKRGFALQKFQNNTWVLVDEIEVDAPPTGTCIMWEPKNATSKTPVKYRLIANKYGNVFVTDVYAEAF
jgi:hypothetical protein